MIIPFNKIVKYFSHSKKMSEAGHFSLTRQLFEMLVLFLFRGLGPGYYYQGRFWRREVPFREKLGHLNQRQYLKHISKLTDLDYRKISQHKVAEKAMLSLFNFPTPKFYGFLHRNNGRTYNFRKLTSTAEFEMFLKTVRPERICFKPVEGFCGKGFHAVNIRYDNPNEIKLHPLFEDKTFGIEAFFSERLLVGENNAGFLVEEYLVQHPWYAKINPTSLNTIRVYAKQSPSGSVEILGSYLRTGRAGSIVDNVSAGGVFWPIDLRSGIFKKGRIDGIESVDLSAHPDSGIQIEGTQLPYWAEISILAKDALKIFPYVGFAGLDIAVSETGPSVIELNVVPDKMAACDLDIPMSELLRLD